MDRRAATRRSDFATSAETTGNAKLADRLGGGQHDLYTPGRLSRKSPLALPRLQRLFAAPLDSSRSRSHPSPLRYLSIYLAFVAVIAGGLLAWSLYHLTRSWLSSRLLRVALASLVVLMPAFGWESTANITNTTWMFLAVLPWALISLEERGRDTVLRSVLAFFGATSSALCLIFIPLALGWLVYRRTRSALIVVVSFFVGVAIQGAVTLSSPPVANGVHSSSILRERSVSACSECSYSVPNGNPTGGEPTGGRWSSSVRCSQLGCW